MSTINKVKVDNVIYDIEDAEARELINSLQTDFNGINIPTKVSELENDNNYLSMNDDYSHITGRLHISNKFDSYIERPVDISTKYLMGAEDGGSPDTLYINYNVDKDVRILEKGTGTLYYKGNEVADRYYVDEQISNSETTTKEYIDEQISNIETGGGITEIPIASATTLGGIKVGANLTIDEDGTLNATASGSSGGEGGNTIAIDNLPIGAVVAYDGEEIPYGYEEVEDYIPIYSTKEQVVGTYLDKPLYKKTFTGTINFEYAGTYYTIIKLENEEKFERVIDYKGFLSDTTNEVGNLYNIHMDGVVPIKLSNGTVDFRTPQMFYNKYFEATIYYTKTTDEEV